MFCSKCGKKISEKSKFCSSCGTAIGNNLPAVKEPPKVPAPPAPPAVQQPKKNGKFCSIILVLFIVFPALYAITTTASSKPGAMEILYTIISILIVVFIFWLVFRILKGLFAVIKKNPKSMVVVIAALIPVYFVGTYFFGPNNIQNADIVQNLLTDAFAEKSIGDNITAGKSAVTLKDVGEKTGSTRDQLKKLTVSDGLKGYKDSTLAFTDKIAVSATNNKWAEAPAGPEPFSTTLGEGERNKLIEKSLVTISQMKEFGDLAVKKGDKESMRYVAARLEAQEFILQNIKMPDDIQTNNILINKAHARPRIVRGACRKDGGSTSSCVRDVRKLLPSVYRPALRYTVGEPDAAQQWDDAWDQVANIITMPEAQPLGGAGITMGDKDIPYVSPTMQTFYNSCKGKGGQIGGNGGTIVKERMPTIESGENCVYNNGACWDYMTYSGRRFMGGNPGCPEEGLLPRPNMVDIIEDLPDDIQNLVGKIPKPKDTPKELTWDGQYDLHYTNSSCNVPGFAAQNISPFAERVTVKNNKITNSGGYDITLNSAGQAKAGMNLDYGNVYGYFEQVFTFTHQPNGGVSVNGNISFNATSSDGKYSVSLQCTGNFSGKRI